MEKFREFDGLSRLRAADLTIKGQKNPIPENARIGDYVKNCDELICDLLSDDLWLFVKYNLISTKKKKQAAVELKVLKDCTVGYLCLVVEKLALNLWSYLNSNNPKYYYVLKEIIIKAAQMPKNGINELSFDTPGEIIHDLMKDKKVSACFDSESMLLVKVDISTLEESLMDDPIYALSKYEHHDNEMNFSQSELESGTEYKPRDSQFSSYMNLNKLQSPKTQSIFRSLISIRKYSCS